MSFDTSYRIAQVARIYRLSERESEILAERLRAVEAHERLAFELRSEFNDLWQKWQPSIAPSEVLDSTQLVRNSEGEFCILTLSRKRETK